MVNKRPYFDHELIDENLGQNLSHLGMQQGKTLRPIKILAAFGAKYAYFKLKVSTQFLRIPQLDVKNDLNLFLYAQVLQYFSLVL